MFRGKYFRQMHATYVRFAEFPQILQQFVYVLHFAPQTRHFFGFHGRKKEYHGTKLVGYSCEQMFDVVADVENYKHFVPFCKKSYVKTKSKDYIKAALEIGYPPILESYTSKVTLVRPNLVQAVCFDGKLFSHLVTTWKFQPGLRSNPHSCIVDFAIDFEFKSLLHSNLAYMFFDKVVKQMEGAFLVEAKRRYGQESLPSHTLVTVKS